MSSTKKLFESFQSNLNEANYKKVDVNTLKNELEAELKNYMTEPERGFDAEKNPEDRYSSYYGDYSNIEINPNVDSDFVIRANAELGYESLMGLAERLDKIVQKYDPEAYFDAEDSGRLVCIMDRNSIKGELQESNINESVDWKTPVDVDFDKLDKYKKEHPTCEYCGKKLSQEEIDNFGVNSSGLGTCFSCAWDDDKAEIDYGIEESEDSAKLKQKSELDEEYIPNYAGLKCPKCGSNNYVEVDDEEYEDGTQEFHYECADCGYISDKDSYYVDDLDDFDDLDESTLKEDDSFYDELDVTNYRPTGQTEGAVAQMTLKTKFGDLDINLLYLDGEYKVITTSMWRTEEEEELINNLVNEYGIQGLTDFAADYHYKQTHMNESALDKVRKDSIEKGLLTEDISDNIKLYMNTWGNYNENGADVDSIGGGWMDIDQVRDFLEKHSNEEPFINDVDGDVPFEINEYSNVEQVIEWLEAYENLSDDEQEAFEAIMEDQHIDFDTCMDILESGDYIFFPGVDNDEDLGRAYVDMVGFEGVLNPEYYLDRDEIEDDIRTSLEEMGEDVDNMSDETINTMVDEDIEVNKENSDYIEKYFDYEALGIDLCNDGYYYADTGAIYTM